MLQVKSNECNNANQRLTNTEKRHKAEVKALEDRIRELEEAAKSSDLKKSVNSQLYVVYGMKDWLLSSFEAVVVKHVWKTCTSLFI